MSWFVKLFDPAKKCARSGHKFIIEWRSGYTRPEHFGLTRFVCDEVTQERRACKRCGAADPSAPDWITVRRRGLSGYSWPSSMAREFEDAGELWTEFGRRKIEHAEAA